MMLLILYCISWLRLTSALAVVSSGSNSDAILQLQQQHPHQTPESAMASLATDCKELGITQFDVYGDFESNATSSYLRQFEQEVAREFGMHDAVFMPSGVMAQSIALLIHDEGCGKQFACHESSHLLLHEQDAYDALLHLKPIVISTQSSSDALYPRPLAFEDIENALSQFNNDKVSTLILELPHRELGGTCTPWQDVLKMRDYCSTHNIKFHCDGARIFEATTGYDNKSLKQLAESFDSIYISFYKGLGGLSGAMLLGDAEFCEQARVWLRRFGGNLYTLLPYAVSGWSGYRRQWVNRRMAFLGKRQKLAQIVEMLSSNKQIQSCLAFHPAAPQVNMIHGFLRYSSKECRDALESVEKECGIRVLSRIRDVDESETAYREGFRSKFELSIGDANGAIDGSDFVRGFEALVSALETSKSR